MPDSGPRLFQRLDYFRLPGGFRGRSAIVVQIWWMVQVTLFAHSPQILYGWRRFLLRLFGAQVGNGVLLRPSVRVTYPWKVRIGDRTWIGDNAELYSLGEIDIGVDVVVSQGCYLCTASHDYTKPTFDIYHKKIVIEDQVWLAAHVFVSPGITVGRGTVVGARSGVFDDLPPGMVCLGYPAQPVRPRTTESHA